jgi:hypothetical protein
MQNPIINDIFILLPDTPKSHSVYNMEIKKPSWLNGDFMESALRSAGDPSAKVVSCDIKSVTASGDNYMSNLYRVTLCVTRENQAGVSLIVKTAKEEEHMDMVGPRVRDEY